MLVANLEKLLVTYRELRALGIPFTREHIARLCRQGRFPKPIRLGGDDQSCKAFWRYADVLAWIDARAEASAKLPTQRKNLPAKRPGTRATAGLAHGTRKNGVPGDGARP
jgi:prophage regulatory protein